ncbi:hypothetical protein [Undibacterium sp. Ji22W]|uniref:hypothetical protein n=1 Tax=Undibacterium sp. Ji22W TaxID=3413038 RepID=UPI003BF4518C
MRSRLVYLPGLFVLLMSTALILHGPITQYAHYHAFADTSSHWGIPNALDVLSNFPFAVVGIIGLIGIVATIFRAHDFKPYAMNNGALQCAHFAFALSICATSFGSTYYHLAPDDARLFWDRLPIALACASLLVAVHIEARNTSSIAGAQNRRATFLEYGELLIMLLFAIVSVLWWQHTGDLRLYLGLQVMAIILIPLWQFIYPIARTHRIFFGMAIAAYVLAKLTEIGDAAILAHTGLISGHSIKHLFAAGAAGLILYVWRIDNSEMKY